MPRVLFYVVLATLFALWVRRFVLRPRGRTGAPPRRSGTGGVGGGVGGAALPETLVCGACGKSYDPAKTGWLCPSCGK